MSPLSHPSTEERSRHTKLSKQCILRPPWRFYRQTGAQATLRRNLRECPTTASGRQAIHSILCITICACLRRSLCVCQSASHVVSQATFGHMWFCVCVVLFRRGAVAHGRPLKVDSSKFVCDDSRCNMSTSVDWRSRKTNPPPAIPRANLAVAKIDTHVALSSYRLYTYAGRVNHTPPHGMNDITVNSVHRRTVITWRQMYLISY